MARGPGLENTTAYGQAWDSRDNAVSLGLGAGSSFNDELLSYFGQADKTEAQKAYVSAVQAQDHESREAQKTRDWQTEMSNTSYQRAVKDMTAAGINPALAYQQGGASTPSGATASGKASSGGNQTMVSQLLANLMNTAVMAAGGIAGKAIGAKIASNASTAKVANQLSYNMLDELDNKGA